MVRFIKSNKWTLSLAGIVTLVLVIAIFSTLNDSQDFVVRLGGEIKTVHASYELTKDIPEVKLATKDAKHSLQFRLENTAPSPGQVKNKMVTYKDVMKFTDVEYEVYSNKIKETVILKQEGHPGMFVYSFNVAEYDIDKKYDGSFVFYDKNESATKTGYRKSLFTIPAPYMIDAAGRNSGTINVKTELTVDGKLVIIPSPEWLSQAQYPVRLDPTIAITILTLHSHPQQGEDWVVDFTTQGVADLYITPYDQATIDDDDFVSLSCDGQERTPQILPGDQLYYANWQCNGVGTVVHYTNTAGKHILEFNFGGEIAYAYNTTITETGSNSSGGSGSDFSFTHGLTINEDDVMVAVVTYNSSNQDISDDNGVYAFTEAYGEQNGSESSQYAIFYRVAGASEPSSYSWDFDGVGSNDYSVVIRVFSGVDTSSVWDVTPSVSTKVVDGGTSSVSVPSMTTSNDGAMGMIIAVSDSSSTTYTVDSGYGTEVSDTNRSLGTFIKIWSTAGSTGAITVDLSGSDDITAHQVALKPAPAVNEYPTISSATDSPDPINISESITFSVDWNDADAGDLTRSFICKTNAFASSTLTCSGGYWTSSTSFATTDPATPSYTTLVGDVGSNNYYAFVCDDDNYCSGATSGSFTVSNNYTPTITAVSEAPDPVPVGADIYWSVNWADTAQPNEMVKAIVCKTDAISGTTCTGGEWCRSPVYTNRDPENLCFYTAQSGDVGSNNYYAFVCDDGGTCSSSSSGSFTVEQQLPTIPTGLLLENAPNPTNVATDTPRFSAIFNDPNVGDIANKWCVEVNTQSDFLGTDMWTADGNSCYDGLPLDANCSEGQRCEDRYYKGSSLSLDYTTYYWRIWFWDDDNNKSPTSSTANFTTASTTEGAGVRLKGSGIKGGVRLR